MSREKEALKTNILFYITFGTAIVLLVAGFFLPPMGIIDSSVIQASGILATFAVIGQVPNWIRAAKSFKVQNGNTTIEVTNKEHQD